MVRYVPIACLIISFKAFGLHNRLQTTQAEKYLGTHMNELAGYSLGGYELEEEVGRGSMGVVYRGKQIALSREVAIKILAGELASDHPACCLNDL